MAQHMRRKHFRRSLRSSDAGDAGDAGDAPTSAELDAEFVPMGREVTFKARAPSPSFSPATSDAPELVLRHRRGRMAGFKRAGLDSAHSAHTPFSERTSVMEYKSTMDVGTAEARVIAANLAMSAPSSIPDDSVVDMEGIDVDQFTKAPLRGRPMAMFIQRQSAVADLNARRAQARVAESTRRARELRDARAALSSARMHASKSAEATKKMNSMYGAVTSDHVMEVSRAHALGVLRPDRIDDPIVASIRSAMEEGEESAIETTLASMNKKIRKLRKKTGASARIRNPEAVLNARRFFPVSEEATKMLMGPASEGKGEDFEVFGMAKAAAGGNVPSLRLRGRDARVVASALESCGGAGAGACERGEECDSSDGEEVDALDMQASGFGKPVVEYVRKVVKERRGVKAGNEVSAHTGSWMPLCMLRRPMGLSKPSISGTVMEAPSNSDFVAMPGGNADGLTMMWAIKGGFAASMERSAGALLQAKLEKNPGVGASLSMPFLFTMSDMSDLTSGRTVLNPEGVSVSVCAWNPAHGMFARDAQLASMGRGFGLSKSELEEAESSQYVLVVHVSNESGAGQMYDRLLERNRNADHTVQWSTAMMSMDKCRSEESSKVPVMSYGEAQTERFFRLQRRLQRTLAMQTADFLQSDTGRGDLQLSLLGGSAKALGEVQTDGWTQFVSTDVSGSGGVMAEKAVYLSNAIPMPTGFGAVPVFKGPGRGFHVLSSEVRDARGGANKTEDTKLVPSTAGRLVAPKDAMFLSHYKNAAWVEGIRSELESRLGVYMTRASRSSEDVSREVLCYTDAASSERAYNGRVVLDHALRMYAGPHIATPARHIATVVM